MSTLNDFIEKRFGAIVLFIVCSVASFFMAVSDYADMLIRNVAFYCMLVAVYFILFGKDSEEKVVKKSAVDDVAPPPPPKPDERPFWQFSPSKIVLSKPSGDVERDRKRFEASQRQCLAEEQAERENNDPIYFGPGPSKRMRTRTPPNLRRAALMNRLVGVAEKGWHISTLAVQTVTTPVATTNPTPAQPTIPQTTNIFQPATTTSTSTTAASSRSQRKTAAEKVTSEVFGKQKSFPFGTRPHTIHENMHKQMREQLRLYLERAETFPVFGTSLPGKCQYCEYEVPLVKERRKIGEMIVDIHNWHTSTRKQFEVAKAKATYPAQVGQELAVYQPFKNSALEIKNFIGMLLLWCTKPDNLNRRIRIPDLTKLQAYDLPSSGLLAENANRLINLFLQFDGHTKKAVPEYNSTYQYLFQLKNFFVAWPTCMPYQACLSPDARKQLPNLQDGMVFVVGFGHVPDMQPVVDMSFVQSQEMPVQANGDGNVGYTEPSRRDDTQPDPSGGNPGSSEGHTDPHYGTQPNTQTNGQENNTTSANNHSAWSGQPSQTKFGPSQPQSMLLLAGLPAAPTIATVLEWLRGFGQTAFTTGSSQPISSAGQNNGAGIVGASSTSAAPTWPPFGFDTQPQPFGSHNQQTNNFGTAVTRNTSTAPSNPFASSTFGQAPATTGTWQGSNGQTQLPFPNNNHNDTAGTVGAGTTSAAFSSTGEQSTGIGASRGLQSFTSASGATTASGSATSQTSTLGADNGQQNNRDPSSTATASASGTSQSQAQASQPTQSIFSNLSGSVPVAISDGMGTFNGDGPPSEKAKERMKCTLVPNKEASTTLDSYKAKFPIGPLSPQAQQNCFNELKNQLQCFITNLSRMRIDADTLFNNRQLRTELGDFDNFCQAFAWWLKDGNSSATLTMAKLPRGAHARGAVFPQALVTNYLQVLHALQGYGRLPKSRAYIVLGSWERLHHLIHT